MTKPKISSIGCGNPVARLEKRFEEYKRCHRAAEPSCGKARVSHNKSNEALRALLERKAKLSDSKTKKKRAASSTTGNRKKAKSNQDQLQQGNSFFENRIEATPNVTLNVHSSEIPDIDWDSFDILNNPNFSMSINEQELEGVLNSCYSQTVPSADIKTTQMSSSDVTKICKTSPNIKNDGLFIPNTVNTFKNEDTLFPPLFPPPENHSQPCSQQPVKFEYLSPQNYLSSTTCTYNPTGNIIPPSSNQIDQQNSAFNSHAAMYNVNLPTVNNAPNNLSYQYNNTNLATDQLSGTNARYFYQYPAYTGASTINEHSTNNAENFQLPTMSSGWYNNVPGQNIKSSTCKLSMAQQQQQQHQFVNPSTTLGNYRNYPQYQVNPQQDPSQIQYQQMFSNPGLVSAQPYDTTLGNIANYSMVPEPQHYYYMDYTHGGNRSSGNPQQSSFSNNSRNVDQTDPRFIAYQTNPLLCRNVYQ